MKCPKCRHVYQTPTTRVMYKYTPKNRNVNKRRRRCFVCGLRFTTVEEITDERRKQ